MKREWWVLVLVVGAVGAFFATTQLHDSEPDVDMSDMGPLEIREDTTRLLVPVVGGMVDYAQALNDRTAPAAVDNAALPFVRVLGTGVLGAEPGDVLQRMGSTVELTVAGTFMPAQEEVAMQLRMTGVAERGENAVIAAWIAQNQAALDTLVAASARPHFWSPIAHNAETGLMEPALSPTQLPDIMDALATRAEIARVEGRPGDGWRDAQALLRLSVLLEEAPGSLARVIAHSVQGRAIEWLQRLLEESAPTEELCASVIERLSDMGPPRSLEPDLDRYERFMILDALIGNAGGPATPGLNPALRAINVAYDEATALFAEGEVGLPDRTKVFVETRRAQAKALAQELGGAAGKLRTWVESVASRGANASRMSGEIVATAGLATLHMVVVQVRRVETQRHTLLLAAALRLHRRRSGAFPASLEELVPETIPALPGSQLGAPAASYELTGDGCRVWDEELMIELAR